MRVKAGQTLRGAFILSAHRFNEISTIATRRVRRRLLAFFELHSAIDVVVYPAVQLGRADARPV